MSLEDTVSYRRAPLPCHKIFQRSIFAAKTRKCCGARLEISTSIDEKPHRLTTRAMVCWRMKKYRTIRRAWLGGTRIASLLKSTDEQRCKLVPYSRPVHRRSIAWYDKFVRVTDHNLSATYASAAETACDKNIHNEWPRKAEDNVEPIESADAFPSYSRPARPKFKNLFERFWHRSTPSIDRRATPRHVHAGIAVSQALPHLNSLKETVTVILVCATVRDSFAVAHCVAPRAVCISRSRIKLLRNPWDRSLSRITPVAFYRVIFCPVQPWWLHRRSHSIESKL